MAAIKPKRKKSISPTRRTLIELRSQGWLVEVVEQHLPKCFITRDLFNVIDAVGISAPDDDGFRNTAGFQITSGSNHAARREKALAEPRLRAWLEAKNLFYIVSWAKQGARGERKRWLSRAEQINLSDLPAPGPANDQAEAK